jgi:hypothetical protein
MDGRERGVTQSKKKGGAVAQSIGFPRRRPAAFPSTHTRAGGVLAPPHTHRPVPLERDVRAAASEGHSAHAALCFRILRAVFAADARAAASPTAPHCVTCERGRTPRLVPGPWQLRRACAELRQKR